MVPTSRHDPHPARIVRPFLASDTEAVDPIMEFCTRELRRVYAPRPDAEAPSQGRSPSARIVAVDATDGVVGVAESIHRASALYVQGIAVALAHRRRGVAAGLLAYCTGLAADAGLPALELATIKETGNVEVFRRLGFRVVHECVSERFRGCDQRPVTEVTLRRQVA